MRRWTHGAHFHPTQVEVVKSMFYEPLIGVLKPSALLKQHLTRITLEEEQTSPSGESGISFWSYPGIPQKRALMNSYCSDGNHSHTPTDVLSTSWVRSEVADLSRVLAECARENLLKSFSSSAHEGLGGVQALLKPFNCTLVKLPGIEERINQM